jgi:hypothetical protein
MFRMMRFYLILNQKNKFNMFIVINKQERPNEGVKFYHEYRTLDKKINDYFYNKYVLPGKFIKLTKELENNGLTLITKIYWSSHQDALDFLSDDNCYNDIIQNKEYNEKNNITTSISIEET